MTPTALPGLLVPCVVTLVLSFVLGLELHGYRRAQDQPLGFGTTRTLSLLGLIGFVLWQLDNGPAHLLYGAGLLSAALWLGLAAYPPSRSRNAQAGTAMPLCVALITYLMGPLVLTQPVWLVAVLTMGPILAMAEMPRIRRFSDAMPVAEGATFAKFLLLAGVVLPLLPREPLPGLPGLSFSSVWLAVVVVCGISYAGYLARRYLFPRAGMLLTGVLGGVYSSTATTVVLARQARNDAVAAAQAPSAVLIASAVMYVRLWGIVLMLGSWVLARRVLLPFALLIVMTAGVSGLLWRRTRQHATSAPPAVSRHPLELSVAFVFAALFVLFAAITHYVTAHFGNAGLRVLSIVVGFTDIDPFVLSLLGSPGRASTPMIAGAIVLAAGSNNLLKACYAMVLSRQRSMLPAALWLAATLALSLLWVALT
ncbi:DUF4010 domain-containing protein [Oleiagrimonas sp. C23AA]|uniref:MgtC/SapB family protein n=1 Tax=Oleiagrimonas sp. C23AA TaxID=2719047 RepID=UPI00142291F8|nr:DUF4010 domain-containing protein [Oleiagrimonas sp. C23AA]NII09336.1 DUF4010 domain-containing protein [Oleiagrimonas sp. C23AA]